MRRGETGTDVLRLKLTATRGGGFDFDRDRGKAIGGRRWGECGGASERQAPGATHDVRTRGPSPRRRLAPPVGMQSIAHVGLTIKDCRAQGAVWMPAACPACGRGPVGGHGSYRHGAEPEERDGLSVRRFRCRAYGQVWGVLPDALLPGAGGQLPGEHM